MSRLAGLGLLAVLGFCACATTTIDRNGPTSFSFKLFPHYSWLPTPGKMGPGLPDQNPALTALIQGEVDEQLTKRGYAKSDLANAQWMVEYQVYALDPAKVGADHPLIGSLMINMTAGVPSQLVWQALVKSTIDLSLPSEVQARMIHDAIVKLLKDFPRR